MHAAVLLHHCCHISLLAPLMIGLAVNAMIDSMSISDYLMYEHLIYE